jgi:hypothetical protein
MCCNKILCIGILVILALFLGCNKGKNTAAKKTEINKALSTADTADIFKEFYSEDTAKKSPAKKTFGKTAKNETFSPASAAASSQVEFSENGRYVVQVSCVKSEKFADKMAGGLKEKGYPAYVSEVQNPTPNLSGAYYRIRIGGFKAFSAAKSFGENTLSPNGYQYWVDKKSNDKVGMEGYGLGTGAVNGNAASSYESATPPSSSWSSPSTPAGPSQSSSSPTVPSSSSEASSPASSSSSAVAPDAPAPAKTGAAANPGFGAPSPSVAPSSSSSTPAPSSTPQPSSAPSAAPQPSSAPSAAPQPSSAPSAAPQPSSAPSTPTQPPGGNAKSSTSGSGTSDWGTDTSASGSGW